MRRGSRRGHLAAFLARRRLSLHPEKTHVASTSSPATFLGFELWPGAGVVGCRRRTCGGFRNRRRGLRDRWRAGDGDAGRGGTAGSRLGGARGARRHVAAAPRDLPGRVVRAGPGGLTGPRPSCGSRRLLEQQRREPPAWRAPQSLGPSRSRPRRARVGASRAGHDEPGAAVFARGGLPDGSGTFAFSHRPITPFMGPSKEGTRIFHSVKPSTNLSKDMRAGNSPNPHERNGLTWI